MEKTKRISGPKWKRRKQQAAVWNRRAISSRAAPSVTISIGGSRRTRRQWSYDGYVQVTGEGITARTGQGTTRLQKGELAGEWGHHRAQVVGYVGGE
eukprot:5486155-Pyramimonas_sp.AAC.1